MKEVTIKSKIVGRGGTDVPSRGGMDVSIDMSDYLLKKIWDSVFEIRTSEDGVEYLLSKMNMAVQGGISSFIDGGGIDLPGLYDGIPFDNRTIWMNPDTGVVEVIGGTGGGSISVGESGSGNAFTEFEMDGDSLILVKGENFALQSDFENLQNSFSSFLEGSDTDTIINKWKELENFLTGLKESDNLADILSDKADKATTLAGYGITNAYTKSEVDDLFEGVSLKTLSWSGYSSGSYDGSTAKSIVIPSNTNQLTNGAGFISEVTKAMVTSALGYTPYNSTNPNGYVTSSGRVSYADEADYATSSGSCTGNAATATELKTSRTLWGQSFDGSGNVTGNMSSVGNIIPGSNAAYHLGDSSKAWEYMYTRAIYIYDSTFAISTFTNGLQIRTYSLFKILQGSTTRLYMDANGNFGINTSAPKAALHVAGTVQANTKFNLTDKDTGNATLGYGQGGTMILRHNTSGQTILSGSGGTLYFRPNGTSSDSGQCTINSAGNMLVTGGITSTSDIRKKTKLKDIELGLEEIADAPLILFNYNFDKKKTIHAGSIAQYWEELNGWFCNKDDEGYLSMDIQSCALVSSISLARELRRCKKRMFEMEEKIKELEGGKHGNL